MINGRPRRATPQQPPFGNDYLDLVSDFARHAASAKAMAACRAKSLTRSR
ncbi:hypothetical protein MAHJHV27_31390 [Mycobacterium avium subsp. hominissuis]